MLVLNVLNPFEIADGHSSGVGKNVRQDGNSTGSEDTVSSGRRRAVSSFDNQACLDSVDVVSPNLVLKGSWNQNIAFQLQQIAVGNGLAAGQSDDRSVFFLEG